MYFDITFILFKNKNNYNYEKIRKYNEILSKK